MEQDINKIIRDSITPLLTPRIDSLAFDKKDKAIHVSNRLIENMQRLHNRYCELNKAADDLGDAVCNKENKEDTTHLQLILVDKIEGFNQHVYALISTLVLVLTHLAPKVWKVDMPIRSIQKFLEYLKKKNQNDKKIIEAIDIIEKSREFRARFIDHVQQHIVQSWMTHTYRNDSYIIYYISKSNNIYHRGVRDPNMDGFIPPVDCESFYVSPNINKTYIASVNLI
ncbi:MAG: hypothetical protein WC868_09900, partial [Bacteroidales bacterium]